MCQRLGVVSPLCIITLYCHIKRKRNQNWLFVQLYCLIFHHGQTELPPLIRKNFFLSPRTFILLTSCYLCLTLFVILTSVTLEILKKCICVVFMSIHFYLLLFGCFPLCHTAGCLVYFFVSDFLVLCSMSISRDLCQGVKRICILSDTYSFLPGLRIYE